MQKDTGFGIGVLSILKCIEITMKAKLTLNQVKNQLSINHLLCIIKDIHMTKRTYEHSVIQFAFQLMDESKIRTKQPMRSIFIQCIRTYLRPSECKFYHVTSGRPFTSFKSFYSFSSVY